MPFDIYNKEFQNWLKGVFGLNKTRHALCECISDKLDNVLNNLPDQELNQYFLCLQENNISLLNTKSKGSTNRRWKCEHTRCRDLMDHFIHNHKQEHKLKYTWAPLGKSENHGTTGGGYLCQELKWNVIKLYMHFENEDVMKQCTSLDNIDITHVIKIMRNCKLISTNDLEGPLEEVLASRNKFMHSPDNKMTDNETCDVVQCTRKLLDCLDIAEKTYYKNAVQELQDLSENDFILRYQSEECQRILADVLDATHLANELYSAIEEDNQLAKRQSKHLQDKLESIAGKRSTTNTRLEMKLPEYKRISKEFLEEKIEAIKLDQMECDRNSTEYKKMEALKERTEQTVKEVIEQMQKLEPEEMIEEIEKLRREKETLKSEIKQNNAESTTNTRLEMKLPEDKRISKEFLEKKIEAIKLDQMECDRNNTEYKKMEALKERTEQTVNELMTLQVPANETMPDVSELYKGLKIFQRPQCLLETDEDEFLTIVQETADEMKQITSPVNVVAIAGLYRTGKSYLMNRLAGVTEGFALGSSIQSKTKGIWAWCRAHPTQKGQVLLLLDTEGLGDAEKGSQDHDNRIFIIATLLSSTLVYNMMTAFSQEAIEKLTFITKMSENLKVSVTDTTDDNFDLLMPDFVLCIRDFTLDLVMDGKECSADEYIEHCLREKKIGNSKLDETYNRPRLCIKKYFTKRKAFTFDRPAPRKAMKNLGQAKEEDLTSDFVHETKRFIEFIYDRQAKMLHNKKLVTGRMLLELLDAFVAAMKKGTVPYIDDVLTTMSKQENERHATDAIDSFHDELGKINMPVWNKTQLLEKMFFTQSSILTDLNSKLLFDDNHVVEMTVKAEMEKMFKVFEEENDKQVYEKCMTRITNIYKEVKQNIERGTYMVSGGFAKYKKDMQNVVEKYEIEQKNENIDPVQINKAKRDFLVERQAESETILTEDKSISEQEQKDELEKRQKKLEADFKEAQEKALKHSHEDIERQRKQHEERWAIVQKTQEEKEATNKAVFFEEILARRNTEILDMATKLVRLEGRLEAEQEAAKAVQTVAQAPKTTQETQPVQLTIESGCSVS